MPLDILYEIFGYLTPSDLIQLSRVTRGFRKVLLSRQSLTLWRASYRLVVDTPPPPCPEDVSEPAWAHLLFGGPYCHSCGTKPVNKILFIYRRRACQSCMEQHLVAAHNLRSRFPGIRLADKVDMVPYWQDKTAKQYSYLCFWWDDDVLALRRDLDALLEKHGSEESAAYLEELEKMRSERAAIAERKMQHSQECQKWEDSRVQERARALGQIKMKRMEGIKSRFMALGYSGIDVDSIHTHPEVNISKLLTDRVWKRILPILRIEVEKAHAERLDKERAARRSQRERHIERAWIDHLRGRPPRFAALAPPHYDSISWPTLCELIEHDESVTPDFEDRVNTALQELGPALQETVRKKAEHLVSLLPQDNDSPDTLMSQVLTLEQLESSDFFSKASSGLGLASSYFACGSHPDNALNKFHGFGMLAHYCGAYEPHFCETKRNVVLQLLESLRMEPASTTALDLDRVDARFVCLTCDAQDYWVADGGMITARQSLIWRACVRHDNAAHQGHARFQLLDKTQTTLVKTREYYASQIWGCGHCNVRQETSAFTWPVLWYNRANMNEHLLAEHGISEAMQGTDFFADPCATSDSGGGYIITDPPEAGFSSAT
ncbi:hypothetical protein FA95DRAFT_1608547 [Auriscalpium vulgare]|uniref:Uncharacterized protein n=1 Tax=Auriscalpium vulgare TaxID=40419 RepID=A0ACB8RJY5_9AGAM|nr:hypothetical protein FA95DRAFT_1608547 [Auriscalpium vulgare]